MRGVDRLVGSEVGMARVRLVVGGGPAGAREVAVGGERGAVRMEERQVEVRLVMGGGPAGREGWLLRSRELQAWKASAAGWRAGRMHGRGSRACTASPPALSSQLSPARA